jgi:hypothetical protein
MASLNVIKVTAINKDTKHRIIEKVLLTGYVFTWLLFGFGARKKPISTN